MICKNQYIGSSAVNNEVLYFIPAGKTITDMILGAITKNMF